MKKIIAVLLGIMCLFAFAACSQESDVFRVGVKIDVPRFGYQSPETGQIEGFEVDVAKELARKLPALRITCALRV